MPDFHITQEKINALLEELRSWEPGEEKHTLTELAKQFGLDVFVVDRVVRSEGMRLKPGYETEESTKNDREYVVDPDASTLDLDPDEIHEALERPDPNPDYEGDVDTGVWRKKPTGEWELVGKDIANDGDEEDN